MIEEDRQQCAEKLVPAAGRALLLVSGNASKNDGLKRQKRSRSRVVNVLPSDYMRYELDQLCQVFENFQTGMTKKQEMD